MAGPTQPLNQLAQRFDKRTQVAWLAENATNLPQHYMRELMVATRLLGAEETHQSEDMVTQRWEQRIGDYTMRLVFQAMSDPEKVSAGFQFKVLQGLPGFESVMMNGYDSRTYDAIRGDLRDVTSHVSMAKGIAGIKSLQDSIEKMMESREVGGLPFLKARALRNDLI